MGFRLAGVPFTVERFKIKPPYTYIDLNNNKSITDNTFYQKIHN